MDLLVYNESHRSRNVFVYTPNYVNRVDASKFHLITAKESFIIVTLT